MKRLPDISLLREVLTYDPESGELRWKVKPARNVNIGDLAGCNLNGYRVVSIGDVDYLAHRICWALHYGEDPYPHIVDHKKGKEEGNGISNLRLATRSDNGLNRKTQSNNTSGHRGVWKQGDKWRAKIKLNGKVISLGIYNCVEEAIAARLQAEADDNIYVRE
jgi:hypothetical protein